MPTTETAKVVAFPDELGFKGFAPLFATLLAELGFKLRSFAALVVTPSIAASKARRFRIARRCN
ncbi:MAG: hypothetical protein QM784_00040 [Polyangiaceae bacterium]